ncbi:hypothetical protein H8B02_07160 [Bradyrhizobium sp. Pear77]|uniref:hypothetical protein n=1 Tax=Bradyrhizobium altum TaxID=1571202 RepID=UPI001E5FBCE9|nr:hypothetical protein [Bradyrhizobium altum]MCC8953250.1 hypothetical protein [Bradyrhizobium altum]
MKFTETAPTLPRPNGPPLWLGKLTQDATLEGAVLKRAVHGKENILALISHARTLYEFQDYTYYGNLGDDFFVESYRSSVQGTPIECSLLVHMDDSCQADSVLIHHYPLDAALLFSRLMWQKFGDRFGELYLTAAQANGIARASDK